ncbi:CBF/Mak21 family-domain-containing protein [Kockovaella imperatae]|uniref:CBF/Mak21 family-domain-containing protein n=1 Tax=Kockovaella imperatae TaxID=4999 RepID=A0A1Y1UI21_9TREE|nr:CBF/Mak21 family-domain-containing protein [Kockovaella imperatae]ORX37639.1 CBF/Mak21 family-domain-containing protein [Kockovaella imperatae]
MGRKNGDTGYKAARKNVKSSGPADAAPAPSSSGGKASQVSAELRQAVKDLGGDEEDLKLIEGIDEEDDFEVNNSSKSQGKEAAADEKSLRKALGEFMKTLDLPNVAPVSDTVADKDEDDSDVNESDDDDVESAEEDEDEEDDDDDDEEEEEDAEDLLENEMVALAPNAPRERRVSEPKMAAPTVEKVTSSNKGVLGKPVDVDQSSATRVPAATSWSSLFTPPPPLTKPLGPIPLGKLNTLRQKAQGFLDNLPPLNRASSSSDAAFISQILQSGTHQDKLSALVLLVRESPMHAVKELNRLRNMAGWKEDGLGGGGNKDQRIAVLKALADWWISGGGKESGKLKYFADQPLLGHPEISDRHLLLFAFEDFLKKWFFSLLQVLEASLMLSHDTLPYIRTQALHIIFQLLAGNAEQEQNLLRLGVNKLGDMDRSVASKTSHHILQLLQVHPAMKAVVAREVSSLILKPSSGQEPIKTHIRFDDEKGKAPAAKHEGTSHARYYGIITLNQITLTSKDQQTAARMVELYFEIFREILGASEQAVGEQGPAGIEKVAGKVEKWRGRRKGAKPKGGRKSALEEEALVDAGEAKLVAAVLTGINRALPYAKLDEDLLSKYMDTLFKITHRGTFNTSIQALNLIFTVSRTQTSVVDRFYRTLYDSLFDERLVTSSKQAMYLNLFFKAVKSDSDQARAMAFVKRLLQMLGMQQPPFVCGALYLLGDLFSTVPGLRRMLSEPEDDEVEHFVDADRPQDDVTGAPAQASGSRAYDGKKREPRFANADASCLWELLPFLDHFHPSISLQASQLLNSEPITGSSDISLNTLVSFLDRFVYRNPKKNLQPKGASIMQPAAASDKSGLVVKNKGARIGDAGFVNSEAFWRKKIEDVPADQLFFHQFFASKLAKAEGSRAAKSEGKDDESEMGSALDSDAEEDEVWKAMQASMPGADDGMDLSDDSSDILDDESASVDEVNGADEDDEDDEDAAVELGDDDSDGDMAEDDVNDSDSDSPFPDFADEDDDIISDDEMPNIELEVSPSPEPEVEESMAAGKRKRNKERREQKKKRKEMPVFGSYEEYAKLIEQDDDQEEEI